MITVLYFGTYSYSNPRNAIIIKGLRRTGMNVLECRVRPRFLPLMYLCLLAKYFSMRSRFDVMIVGFPGQEVILLAHLLTRKPIIFDAFTSYYLGYVVDRKYWSPGSLRALWARFLDRWSCKLADAVLLDTNAQIDYFVREFHCPKRKFHRVWVGTDTDIFQPMSNDEFRIAKKELIVHFHGTGVPLQGIEVIRAAERLMDDGSTHFQIIVGSDSVPYEKLPELIERADICLGIFGASEKAQLVIPNKVFEYAAMRKPIITLDTPSVRELFDDRSAILLPRPDPQLIAAAIKRLRCDDELRARLGRAAHDIIMQHATTKHIGERVASIIHHL